MISKLSTLFIFTFLTLKVNASILLVNNTPGGPGQYTQINDAMAAAVNGDTIYVSGSTITYADATINKNITLIGPGCFAQKEVSLKAKVISLTLISNISNVKISGFYFEQIGATGASNINNLDISYNNFNDGYWYFFDGLINCLNWNIHNNVFSGYEPGSANTAYRISSAGGCANFAVQNNIYHWNQLDQVIKGFNFPNGIIQNNTFISAIQTSHQIFSTVSDAIIQNNIFYNCNPTLGVTNGTYNNNISFSTAGALPVMGGNNIDNIDPLLVNVNTATGFSIAHNYNVQTSSLAHNAGSDGKDIGYYGGINVIDLTPTGEIYNIPVIRQMLIQNLNVPQSGNVNVKVRSTKARTN
jgi:hypothetical protein